MIRLWVALRLPRSKLGLGVSKFILAVRLNLLEARFDLCRSLVGSSCILALRARRLGVVIGIVGARGAVSAGLGGASL